MADNIELNAGSGGATLATDDAGVGGHVQIVKLAISTDGSATAIPAEATNGLDVDVTRVQGTVTVDGSGVTQPVSHAALTELAAAIDTELQVDVVAALPAGTNNIGDVDVLTIAAGDNNIGNVDIVTVPAPLSTTGGGTEAAALRVTIATDSTGVLSVDDNGGSITVDNAGLTELAAAIDTEVQCDIVGALPAGTNAIGKLAANSGVDIGDVDVTSISAGANSIGNVGIIPRTTGGMTIFRSIDIDESEEEIKASAGQVFSISAFNRTAAPLYLKFYNLTAANTTVGTSTPVLTFVVPANADSDGAGFVWNNAIGFAFSTAISVACTTGVADSDTGAPGANDCVINVGYA